MESVYRRLWEPDKKEDKLKSWDEKQVFGPWVKPICKDCKKVFCPHIYQAYWVGVEEEAFSEVGQIQWSSADKVKNQHIEITHQRATENSNIFYRH